MLKTLYKHWRKKIDNAPAGGHFVDDGFKCFPSFVYNLGWKPCESVPYEIHRREPELGYTLGNCVWLDKTTNLKLRGRAEQARTYAKAYGVTVRTAYRYLEKTQEPVDFERKALIERARQLYEAFYTQLEAHYPGTIPIIPKPTQSHLNQLANLLNRYCGFLNEEVITFIISHWQEFNDELVSNYEVELFDKPALRTLLTKFEWIYQEYKVIEARTLQDETQEGEPVYQFTLSDLHQVVTQEVQKARLEWEQNKCQTSSIS